MRLLVGAGTPKEAVARGWGFFLAQSPGDGASNTAILLFWITSASDPHAIARVITESPKPAEPPFCQRAATPPARLILDIDATDVETHGRQENAFFHGYYQHRCFLPLYVFCGRHLLLAQLRPANIDGARGARNQTRRIVRMIRERWPNVDILLRGDSGFARENLMHWCEGNAVDYVFGLARNEVLLKKARRTRGKAAMAMVETGQPVRAYGDFHHMTKSRTWARPRRVIAKVEHRPRHEQRCRFLVTSLDCHQVPPGKLYEDIYCPRGDMENRIKDCQLDLFASRMSAHAYKANQLRLIFAAFAYVLIDGIRRDALNPHSPDGCRFGPVQVHDILAMTMG